MTVLQLAPESPVTARRAEIVSVTWQSQLPPPHEFLAAIIPDEDGGYSVVAANYPEVVSQGDTVDEAKANVAEAFKAVLEACRNRGRSMEFSDDDSSLPADCQKAWITVDG